LFEQLAEYLSHGPLQGCRVVVTAGPTHEPIDPVRYIGNRSSGKMGFALAAAFARAGASVRLVAGPVSLPTPAGVARTDVETALQMYQVVQEVISECDLFAACAAVADYRVEQAAGQKIKKQQENLQLTLVPNPDILAWVAGQQPAPFTLGFAAETENLHENASAKRIRKGVDMIAANLVGTDKGGFAADDNALSLFWQDGSDELPMMDKNLLATELVRRVTNIYLKRNS
jgi:phosphopantothenoylcysteine decarboxylase/phosphopantothenate--cysteine ligase